MRTIGLSEATYARIQRRAIPLEDDAESVISRMLDFYDKHTGAHPDITGHLSSPMIRLPVGTRKLTHTRLLTATVNGVERARADWNSLARDMHALAYQRLGSFEAVLATSCANLRAGRVESQGYRHIESTEFSLQGSDANNTCRSSFRLAIAMNMALRVTFEWRDRPDAAYPGREGLIEWTPTTRTPCYADEPADAEPTTTWKEATMDAIRRVVSSHPDRAFTLSELKEKELPRIVHETRSTGQTPDRTLERVCQELRDAGILEFLDDRGTYRLSPSEP